MTARNEMAFYVSLIKGKEKTRVDLGSRVLSFTFEDNERKADKFSIEVDNWDLRNFDTEVWAKGNTIEMSWGYVGNMSPARQMLIKSVKGGSTLKVEGVSKAFAMDTTPRNRTFITQKRSDIVATIAGENGYEGSALHIEDTEEVLEGVSQANMTDAAFVRKLANKEGFEFFVDFDGFHFHQRNTQQVPSREFIWYTDKQGKMLSFNIENDVTVRKFATIVAGRNNKLKENWVFPLFHDQQLAKLPTEEQNKLRAMQGLLTEAVKGTVNGVDRAKQARDAFSRTVSEGFARQEAADKVAQDKLSRVVNGDIETFALGVDVEPSSEPTEKAGKRKAQGDLRRKRLLTVKLTMEVVGEPQLIAKTVMRIGGIGERLSGNYYCKAITHNYGSSGYTCTVKCLRDGQNRSSAKLFKGGGAGGRGGGGSRPIDFENCDQYMATLENALRAFNQFWALATTNNSGNWFTDGDYSGERLQNNVRLMNLAFVTLKKAPDARYAQAVKKRAQYMIDAHSHYKALYSGGVPSGTPAKADAVWYAAADVESCANVAISKAIGDKAVNDERVTRTSRRVEIEGREGTEIAKKNSDGTVDYIVAWDDGKVRRPSVPKKVKQIGWWGSD